MCISVYVDVCVSVTVFVGFLSILYSVSGRNDICMCETRGCKDLHYSSG